MSGDHNMYGDGTVYRPLTEGEIERLLSKHERDYDMVKFARAIERAHGIGGNDE